MINSVSLVYAQVLAEAGKRERKPRHYPSSACATIGGKFVGKCRRATWYEWKGVERTDSPDAPALFKMGVGDMIHEKLSGYLERALLTQGYREEHVTDYKGTYEGVGDEVAVLWQEDSLKYPFSGRMDKRFISPEGLRVVAEWKSTYGAGIDDVKRNGPKVEALLQIACYLRQKAFEVDAAILMYAARDSGYLFGYWIEEDPKGLCVRHMNSTKVEVSPVSYGAVVECTRMLEEYFEGAEPPPCDFTEKDWQCRYCSHRRLCQGG